MVATRGTRGKVADKGVAQKMGADEISDDDDGAGPRSMGEWEQQMHQKDLRVHLKDVSKRGINSKPSVECAPADSTKAPTQWKCPWKWGESEKSKYLSPRISPRRASCSAQDAFDLASDAVSSFKTPSKPEAAPFLINPPSSTSSRMRSAQAASGAGHPHAQEAGTPSRGDKDQAIDPKISKLMAQSVMTPGITGKLLHRIEALYDTLKENDDVDIPMTPYVLSSCSCAASGKETCTLHGHTYDTSSVKKQARPSTYRKEKRMQDAMSPVLESTSMLSETTLLSPDTSIQLPSTSSKKVGSCLLDTFEAAASIDTAKTTHVSPRAASGGLREAASEENVEGVAGRGVKRGRDIVVRLESAWRKDNGFQVWEVVQRNDAGDPLRGVELLPLGMLETGLTAPAKFEESELAVGKKSFKVVKLTREQQQVHQLHDKLAGTSQKKKAPQ